MVDKVRLTRQQRGQVRKATNRLTALERREFPSESDSSRSYIAMILLDGCVTCNCRGWTMKKGPFRRCKHTDELLHGRPVDVREDRQYLAGPHQLLRR